MSILKDNFKINNPLARINVISSYNCNHQQFNFERQTKNYNELKKMLDKIGIYFTDVYAVKLKTQHGIKYSFVVDTNVNMVWYKYASGKNSLVLNDRKIDISNFLNDTFLYKKDFLKLINYDENNNNDNIDLTIFYYR